MCMDMLHYGLLPIIDHVNSMKRSHDEMESKLAQFKDNPSACIFPCDTLTLDAKAERVCKNFRNLRAIYDVALGAMPLAQKMQRLFRLHINLMLCWGGYDSKVSFEHFHRDS